jgi:hypothetical protein
MATGDHKPLMTPASVNESFVRTVADFAQRIEVANGITPEMLSAGAEIAAKWDYNEDLGGINTYEDLVKEIYTAMRSKAQKCDCQDGE